MLYRGIIVNINGKIKQELFTMLNFSKRLIEEREKTGYSAEEFAVLGGVGKTTQYNYEKGLRKPDLEYLYNIAQLDCDIHYIVTGIRLDNSLSNKERELLSLYRSAEKPLRIISMKALEIDLSKE